MGEMSYWGGGGGAGWGGGGGRDTQIPKEGVREVDTEL